MNDSKKEILLHWEKRRIAYNLILLIEGLILLWGHYETAFSNYWRLIVIFVIAANVCYCLGPLLEIVVRALMGSRVSQTKYQSFLAGLRHFLFLPGLLFSMWWIWMWVLRGMNGHL